MQYLLTEDEYKVLVHKDETVRRDNALAAAREEMLRLADFDCIHQTGGRNEGGYCDACPCSPIKWGAKRDYATWNRICWLSKDYSK